MQRFVEPAFIGLVFVGPAFVEAAFVGLVFAVDLAFAVLRYCIVA